jgi:hypothetical protein
MCVYAHNRIRRFIMKTSRAGLAATAIPLLLTSLPIAAGELPFNAPNTVRAQESAELLHQAARALGEQAATTAGAAELPGSKASGAQKARISNLWIFPTADTDTVFAQYDVGSTEEGASATKHLTVLKVHDSRIVEQKELTNTKAYAANANPHWTASIGTGHAADSNVTAAHGVPANADWTARIGTGTAASSAAATGSKQAASAKSAVADAHWTSRIGTGHAVDSTTQEGT